MTECAIKKTDEELQIVYAEVYVPDVPDAHNEFMSEETIRKMAHGFMAKGFLNQIDTNHDNEVNGSYVVESFIARKGDPDFIAGAWVVGVHVPDVAVWGQIKKGELNGFSVEAFVQKVPRVIELEMPEYVEGGTDVSNGHSHVFKAFFDEDGALVGGSTNIVDGHTHSIMKGTITEEADGHIHRFSYIEDFVNG